MKDYALKGTEKVRNERNSKLKELIAQGHSTTKVAKMLGITPRSVRRIKALTT